MESKKIWLMIGIIAIVAVILAVTLGLVFGLQTDDTSSNNDVLDDKISQDAEFPNGSYIKSVDNFASGPVEAAPKNLSADDLSSFGVRVEDSSFVAETGRKHFFYIWLPPMDTRRSKRDTSDAQDGLAIRFGNAQNLNVVPVALADVPQSGVRKITGGVGSGTLYEIQARMPESLCQQAGVSSCTTVNWTPYRTTGTSASAGSGNALAVSCGSQCDTDPNSACATSCSTCDAGGTVDGADTPVTRRYNVGTTSGSFKFYYKTFNIKDRVAVIYENHIIHDTGCVGEEQTVTVTFSGQSSEVRVDVEPNCAGTTGTAWNFRLACPEACANGESRVRLMNGGREITSGGVVYISKDAETPSLAAYYCNNNQRIDWQLKLDAFSHTTGKVFCTETTLTSQKNPWTSILSSSGIRGGRATLTWTDAAGVTGSITFSIAGTQPPTAEIRNLIVTASGNLWYPPYVAEHESGLRQFVSGQPLISSDNGVGIFQLTNPVPTCEQVWSWKANVHAGVQWLNAKQRDANQWMQRQRQQALAEMGRNVPVPDRTEANCQFSDGTTRTINDAVAMKMFNGASGGNYAAWDNGKGKWKFNPMNDLPKPFNYVNRVCQLVR
ncbi:uncharacterized protein LOC129596416 [Paramacrobiotus metropolitanus]|uniref:uncharacterized protein LOC129596416 n=1 Tax=Paramacrobiotus metropolitanus TaxID=2943436 RepID=UPI002445E4D9|nr:uncharacterized protein LOC129596416 [Paramacrobiotus metropolitanus]